MKLENTVFLCLMLAALWASGCISEDDNPLQPLPERPNTHFAAPFATESGTDILCDQDAECDEGMVCDWQGPDYGSDKVCIPGCRNDSQCGVEGECNVDECELPPCAGTCIISAWQQSIDILGFEDASKWTATSGTQQPSTDAVQGESALAVNGPGWQFVLTSAPFGPLPKVDDDVSVAIKLPTDQPNPWWYGQLQLFVDAPSLGLYNRFIAVAELTGLPLGNYVTVDFPLPADVKTLLEGDYSDLTITIALNVPYDATGTYLLDDLRFGDDILPPVITVATSETPQFGEGPFNTYKEDLTLLGHIEEDIAVSDVTVTVGDGTPVHPTVDGEGNFSLPITLDRDFDEVSVTYPITIVAEDEGGNATTLIVHISAVSPIVPDELVIVFNKDTTEAHRQASIDVFSGTLSKRLNDFTWLVVVPKGTASDVVANTPVPSEDIRNIFPNMIIERQFLPNDSLLWVQQQYLLAIHALTAWDLETGSDEVIVAIVDSGIHYSSLINMSKTGEECDGPEEFIDNVYLNEKECCENPPCSLDIDNACVPKSNTDDEGRCPIADLNEDGCPGKCGDDDDGDGFADMEDPEVMRLFNNGFDDDGDGLVDEPAIIDGVEMDCTQLGTKTLKDAPPDGDCDGAANDDDENGYPDDCRGWNFGRIMLPKCTEFLDTPDGTCLYGGALTHPNQANDIFMFQQDGAAHGSNVARVLGEPGNNCKAYTGIAHRVKILPLSNARLFPATAFSDARIDIDLASTIEAYSYAGKAGAHIINSSFQHIFGPDDTEFFTLFPTLTATDSLQRITDLLNLCGTDQALHVVSAGNHSISTDGFVGFPTHANIDNKLVVGASVVADDSVWEWSNYGDIVDLSAPGHEILGNSGTSFATPMVSGAAALLMSKYPQLKGNPDVVADIIRSTARYVAAWDGKSISGGILNVYDALDFDIPENLFINVSNMTLPSPQDNATDDIDMFDADGDGQVDMILEVMCSSSDVKFQPHLRVLDNGKFEDRTVDVLPSFEGSFCDAAEGDLDGDGNTDIVLAAIQYGGTNADNQNLILMNSGTDFSLTNNVIPSDSQMTRALELCDFDADGDLDIYFGNVGSGATDVLLENNNGSFSDVSSSYLNPSGFANSVHKVLCVDLDAPPSDQCDGLNDEECPLCIDPKISVDGLVSSGLISSNKEDDCLAARQSVIPEIILAGGEGTTTVLLRQDSSGVYQDVSCDLNLPSLTGAVVACDDSTRPTRQDYDVETGDFNNDGAPDLVFVSRSGDPNPSNTLLYNNGDGTFDDVTQDKWNIVPDDSREVEVGDVDGDGWDDIIVIRGNPNTGIPGANSLYLNDGSGAFAFAPASGLRTGVSITTDGDLVDFDNDGDLDLIIGNSSEPNMLLKNTTN